MDLCNRVLSKAPVTWVDVQKQLLNLIQSRNLPTIQSSSTSVATIISSSSSISINNSLVKQCTDFLIKHIKNLNQAQVIDQLENLAKSCGLAEYKTPHEEEPTTVNVFLNTEDFYFEVSINLKSEITDVKFSFFSEQAKSNNLLKDIFCSWNWELLSKHIEGIKSNFILDNPDQHIRAKAYRSIQYLETDLNTLYKIQLKYVEKTLTKSQQSLKNNLNHTNNYLSDQFKFLDKLINQTPVGLIKRSELGDPMRVYYYISPLDLIEHNKTKNRFNSTYKILSSITLEQLIEYELGAYSTISLISSNITCENDLNYKLPDCPLLAINEIDDDRILNEYFNSAYSIDRKPLFKKFNIFKQLNKNNNLPSNETTIQIPATFLLNFNKPIVMCLATLNQLQSQIGIETISVDSIAKSNKTRPFFELLAKNFINNKILNDAYLVELPDESQVYYITELDQPNCLGIIVDKLKFTHPQDLVIIFETLRKQLLFNELLLSCMRKLCNSGLCNNTNTNNNSTKSNRIIEIGLVEPFVLSIIMQHPKLLTYTTIEIDVSKGNIETRFRDHNDLHNPNVISEILRRCHSIPVTIRALLMKYRQLNNNNSKKKNNSNNDNNNGDSSNFYSNNQNDNNSNSNNNNNNNYSSSNGEKNLNFENNHKNDQLKDDLNVIPKSLYLKNELNNHLYQSKRLTPSGFDSYNNNTTLYHMPTTLSSLFSFSNLLDTNSFSCKKNSSTKASNSNFNNKQQSLIKLNNKLLDPLLITPSSNKKRKASSSSASSTSSTSSSKSTNSSASSSSSNTTSNTTAQPPSAKRKMTSSQSEHQSQFKRHVSLIDESLNNNNNLLNGSSPSNKKHKLKSSSSSADITSTSPIPITTVKKNDKTSTSSSSSKTGSKKDKDSNILSAIINTNSSSPSGSSTSSTSSVSSNKSSSNKTSSNTNNNLNKSDQHSNNANNKKSSTPLLKDNNNKLSSQQPIKIKPALSGDEKIKKDSNKSRSSSFSIGNQNNNNLMKNSLNLSATEIQLKQSLNSPSSNSLIANAHILSQTTPSSIINNNLTNNRTPSPSLSSLSSLSISNALTTPSPTVEITTDVSSSNDNEHDTKKEIKKETAKPPKNKIDLTSLIKPTPQPTSSSMSGSLSNKSQPITLGLSFKSTNFKIPKTQPTSSSETNHESNSESPLSSSSPISSTKPVGSPNKSSDQSGGGGSQLKHNNNLNKNLNRSNSTSSPSNTSNNNNNNNRNNQSPKWQPTYAGNMSPRYITSVDQISNNNTSVSPLAPPSNPSSLNKNNTKFNNNTTQKSNNNNNNNRNNSSTSTNRPSTPIPNTNNNTNNNNNNRPQSSSSNKSHIPPPPPLMSTKIPSLMSTDLTSMINLNISNLQHNDKMTISSPTVTPQSPPPVDLISDAVNLRQEPVTKKTTDFNNKIPNLIPLALVQNNNNNINSNPSNSLPEPASPTNNEQPIVVPKLIPLERNIMESITATIPLSKEKNKSSQSKLIKSDPVDIASPDAILENEEDDDNLVIDFNNQHQASSNNNSTSATPISSQTSYFVPISSNTESQSRQMTVNLTMVTSSADTARSPTPTSAIEFITPIATIPTSPSNITKKLDEHMNEELLS